MKQCVIMIMCVQEFVYNCDAVVPNTTNPSMHQVQFLGGEMYLHM